MARVHFIQNISHEGPAYFLNVINDNKIDYTLTDLSKGENYPSLEAGDALVVLGGPASANDETDSMKDLIAFSKKVIFEGCAYLGICLGMQVLVKVIGGEVSKSNFKEIGFMHHESKEYRCRLTSRGKLDPLLKDFPEEFPIFQLHGEMVNVDSDKILAEGNYCIPQIVKMKEKAYGVQGHVEIDRASLKEWSERDIDLREMSFEDLNKQFLEREEFLKNQANLLFSNFLNIAGILK